MVRSLINKVIKKFSNGDDKPAAKKTPSVKFKSQPKKKEKVEVYEPSHRRKKAPAKKTDSSSKEQSGSEQPRKEGQQRKRRPQKKRAPQNQHDNSSHSAKKDEMVASHEGWNITQYDIPVSHGKTRFYDLNINDRILHAIADLKFEYCSPIQAEVLPFTLVGKDAFGQAQTGTGKTAAFMIAILDYFLRHPFEGDRRTGRPRALIMAPTRELVMQIHRDALDLSKYMHAECAAVFGGMDYEKQQRQLQDKKIDIVCATPGRLLDFKRRGDLDLSGVEILVLDEADRMLDMGFIPDVREIIHSTPPKSKRQTMLFSATFNDPVKRLAAQWTKDPVTVVIEPESVAVDTVNQIIYIVTLTQRFGLIHHILSQPDMDRAIVFVNRRIDAEKLTDLLDRHAFDVDLLSGAVPQNRRVKTLERFREGKIKVLVATDVAGRGLHVDDVSHVINFSMPDDPEDYVHRIGRTGRAGKEGTSISFATEDDAYEIPKIEKFIGRELPCTVPEDAWLELPEPPKGHVPKRKRSSSAGRPPQRGGGGGRGGPRRSGGRSGGGGRRPPRR